MQQNELPVNYNRDFKGIWIPREIWLAEGMSSCEKVLWAEIHSLFDHQKGGCYASNEYLANFMGVKERTVRDALFKFRQLKLLEDVSFNGRERIIKALQPDAGFSRRLADWRKSATLTGEKMPCSMAEIRHPPLIYDNKGYNKEYISPLTPHSESASPNAAKAADEKVSSSKQIKEKTEIQFSDQVKQVAEKMVVALKTANPDWIPPRSLNTLMIQVHQMINIDGRDPEKIIALFLWAISDSFWMPILCGRKTNPAKYLREQFSQLAGKMNAKPPQKERKFAPSSNDEAALAKIKEMTSRAL